MIRIAEIVLTTFAISILGASIFGSIAMNWHRWRRPGVEHLTFMVFVCLGFLTIGYSRHIIQDELKLLRLALKKLRGDE